jgi:hypothetical protein
MNVVFTLGVPLIALTLGWSANAWACQHAQQYRLIPLGWANGVLVAAELQQVRIDGADDPHSARWETTVALVEVRDNITALKTYHMTTSTGFVAPTPIEEAAKDGSAIPGFVRAKRLPGTQCNYRPDCAVAAVTWDNVQIQFERYAHHKRAPRDAGHLATWDTASEQRPCQRMVPTTSSRRSFIMA